MKLEKKYFSSFVEIEIALLITRAVFSFLIEVILLTSIVSWKTKKHVRPGNSSTIVSDNHQLFTNELTNERKTN